MPLRPTSSRPSRPRGRPSRSGRGRTRKSGSTSWTAPGPRSWRARTNSDGCSRANRESRSRTASAKPARAGAIFKFFAGEALRPGGEKIDSTRPGIDVEITREPIGVVAAITPWNFPLAIPAWKIAPALACGNCVIFKPAELVPASPWTLADIIQRAGLPPGVLNLVMGPGAKSAPRSPSSPDIDAVNFTGSQDVGPSVAAAAVKTGARVQLEMGGKNPLIVLDDADLATAVSVAVNGAFFQAGQRCTASSRLIVTEGIHDRFVEAMVERMKTLVVDDALKAGTEIGPVVDQRSWRRTSSTSRSGRRRARDSRKAAGD